MAKGLEIAVNGKTHKVKATPDTMLLYVLREELRLNGPKFGCGLRQCGACTVLVDGEPVRSCSFPVGDFPNASVTTLEGLGSSANPHPIQQAFIDEQVGQCAFCMNGMMMEGLALLRSNPQPTEIEIREALNNTICRCGGHRRVMRAVLRAAQSPNL
jgi:nicotinate dehydrogenase subunit A